jgi:uncharacterized protein
MSIKDRGFAGMSPERQREIASRGGKAAHKKGTAHEWSREEAQSAGRRGGLRSHENRKNRSLEDRSARSQ